MHSTNRKHWVQTGIVKNDSDWPESKEKVSAESGNWKAASLNSSCCPLKKSTD
jgi:hypothetical protein